METLSDITLIQALMVAIFAGIAGIDLFNVLTHIHRPIMSHRRHPYGRPTGRAYRRRCL